jgi:hypothetical protein
VATPSTELLVRRSDAEHADVNALADAEPSCFVSRGSCSPCFVTELEKGHCTPVVTLLTLSLFCHVDAASAEEAGGLLLSKSDEGTINQITAVLVPLLTMLGSIFGGVVYLNSMVMKELEGVKTEVQGLKTEVQGVKTDLNGIKLAGGAAFVLLGGGVGLLVYRSF